MEIYLILSQTLSVLIIIYLGKPGKKIKLYDEKKRLYGFQEYFADNLIGKTIIDNQRRPVEKLEYEIGTWRVTNKTTYSYKSRHGKNYVLISSYLDYNFDKLEYTFKYECNKKGKIISDCIETVFDHNENEIDL